MQPFIVKLNGLAPGKTVFEWEAGTEFFESFGNPDILGARIEVEAQVRFRGATVDVECSITGTVTVACDRCLEDLEIPVDTAFSEVYTPEAGELDLSQDVYDYVCTALPLRRVHAEGGCNPGTIKFLSNSNI